MLKIGTIVQARMSSERLPGKMLKEVNGKPLLQYIIEKMEHCDLVDEFIVATSTEHSDDQIEKFCIEHDTPCYRGSLKDVSGRFLAVLNNKQWDAFVRVNGDSPLIDSHLISRGVRLFSEGKFDIVTNVFPRTYPPGQSVEIVRADVFKKSYSEMSKKEDFEHVTHFFYRNADKFKIQNFSSGIDYSQIHMSVDTFHDLQIFSMIISKMVKPHWEYHLPDLIKMYQEVNKE